MWQVRHLASHRIADIFENRAPPCEHPWFEDQCMMKRHFAGSMRKWWLNDKSCPFNLFANKRSKQFYATSNDIHFVQTLQYPSVYLRLHPWEVDSLNEEQHIENIWLFDPKFQLNFCTFQVITCFNQMISI